MSSTERPSNCVLFPTGSVSPASRELVVAGKRVDVEPKVFDLIAYLARHRDRAVGRDELISAVWGVTHVGDNVLAQALRKARHALGDSGETQSVIATIVRFGYRWVAPEPSVAAELANSTTDVAKRRSGANRRYAAAGALLVLAMAAVSLIVFHRREDKEGLDIASGGHMVIAVLPTTPTSSSADEEWLRLGFMALVSSALRESTSISVVSDQDTARFVRAVPSLGANDAGQIFGASLGATLVLETSIDHRHDVWTLNYTLSHKRVIALSGSLSSASVGALAHAVVDLVIQRIAGAAEPSGILTSTDEQLARAKDAALRGDFGAADAVLHALADAAPDDGRIMIALADIERRVGRLDASRDRIARLLATSGCEGAIWCADALGTLAHVDLQLNDLDAAALPLQRLLDLGARTNDKTALATAYTGLGYAATNRGDYASAEASYAHSRALREQLGNRIDVARQDANDAVLALAQGRPESAVAALQRAQVIFANAGMLQEQAMTLFDSARAYEQLGKFDQQLAMTRAALGLFQSLGDRFGVVAAQLRMADALITRGELSAALAETETASTTADAEHFDTQSATAALIRGAAKQRACQVAEADRWFARALALYGTTGAKIERDQALGLRAVALAQMGDASAALATTPDPESVDAVSLIAAQRFYYKGLVLAALRRTDDAHAMLARAVSISSEHSFREVLMQSAIALGDIDVDRGDVLAAEVNVGITQPWQAENFEAARLRARYLDLVGSNERDAATEHARRLAGEVSVGNTLPASMYTCASIASALPAPR